MSATASPSKEKYCSLISEIIDKSKDVILESEDVLEYDVVELTLLLKSIGLRLNSLEFETATNGEATDIEVEIRCKQSGMISKLSINSGKCTCPSRKSVNNNSFWEVQGIAPTTPIAKSKGIVQDTSCNLLPDISRKTANFARTVLAVLLQHYQSDFESKGEKMKTIDVKQILDRLAGNISNTNESEESDKGAKCCDNIKDKICSTPTVALNEVPLPSLDSLEPEIPKILNTTEDAELISVETQSNSSMSPGCYDLDEENERDICLIQAITDARKQLDSALLMLKCNVTKDLSRSSILTVTPQAVPEVGRNLQSKRVYLEPSNKPGGLRRHSSGARLEERLHNSQKPILGKVALGAAAPIVRPTVPKKKPQLPSIYKVNKTGSKPLLQYGTKTAFDKVVAPSALAEKRASSETNLKSLPLKTLRPLRVTTTKVSTGLGARNPIH